MKYNKKAKTNDMVFGGLAIALSIMIAGLFFVAALGRFLFGLFGAQANITASTLVWFGIIFTVSWCFVGIKALLRGERSGKYVKLFGSYGRVKVAQIIADNGITLRNVSADLNAMKKCGYFPELTFDLDNKEVVLSANCEPLVQIGDESLTAYKKNTGFPIMATVMAAITFMCFSFNFLVAAIAGAGGFFLVRRFFPAPVYFTEISAASPKLKKPAATGNNDLDSVLLCIFENKQELVRLSGSIVSPKILQPLEEIIHVQDQIALYITENPDKIRNLREFTGYHLPTTTDFLKTYEELESKPVKGDNINATLSKIEEITANLVDVYKREYDDLFCDKVMDIKAEAAVMKAIIKEGESIL
jgi:5-bromo-4-chloroindolyl phosphate hydrolysis protein